MNQSVVEYEALDELKRDPTMQHIVLGIDALGQGSAEAQHLKTPLTSLAIIDQQQHTLYVALNDREALGILKVAKKHLYYYVWRALKAKGDMVEIDPLCVLDFYVRKEHQRHGIGLKLFQYMLEKEHVEPRRLAYDRPSPKLFPFLRKHFAMYNYVDQPNRFVIFDDYFN
ncbi:Alpha-tubulin N-acetyltransferase 1 [Aphanomyces cochlioides]|nr:Alpha-tubulin N-acetyltransferase 1 [Aphanomyces cochlioides]